MAEFLLRERIIRLKVSEFLADPSKVVTLPADLVAIVGKWFYIKNLNPYSISLEGTPPGKTAMKASRTVGWPVGPGETTATWGSKNPDRISIAPFGTGLTPLPDTGYDYSNDYVDLVYLTKGN